MNNPKHPVFAVKSNMSFFIVLYNSLLSIVLIKLETLKSFYIMCYMNTFITLIYLDIYYIDDYIIYFIYYSKLKVFYAF